MSKMFTAFELNEELKEGCVLLGATKAVTQHFKVGVPLIPDEFWETTIFIPKDSKKQLCKVLYNVVCKYLELFEEGGFYCAEPLLEYSFGAPRIIYAIFPDGESFTEKKLNCII